MSFTREWLIASRVGVEEPKKAGTADQSLPQPRKRPPSTTASSPHHHLRFVLQYICDSKTAMYNLCRQLIVGFGTSLQCKAEPRASAWPFCDQCSSNTRFVPWQGALASTHRPLGILLRARMYPLLPIRVPIHMISCGED